MGQAGSSASFAHRRLAALGERVRTSVGARASRGRFLSSGLGLVWRVRHIFDVEGIGADGCVLSVFDMAQLWSKSESRRLAHTVEDISASSLNPGPLGRGRPTPMGGGIAPVGSAKHPAGRREHPSGVFFFPHWGVLRPQWGVFIPHWGRRLAHWGRAASPVGRWATPLGS